MYNLGYAKANSLPELSEKWVIGRHFDIVLGESTVPVMGLLNPLARRIRAEVVGLTSNPALLGVVMPAKYVEQFNGQFSPQDELQYSALHIQLFPDVDIEQFEQKMASMGLRPDSQRELMRRAQFFLKTIVMVLLVFSALVLFVAFSNVVNTFSLILLQRRFEIGLLRAVGATRWTVAGLIAGEAGVVGALGGALGAALAFALAWGVNVLCQRYLPPLSILPPDQSFMIFGWDLAVAGIAFAAITSMLVTLPLVLRATAVKPARLLRQE